MEGFVGGEHVVEGTILTDDDDHVFDGRGGRRTLMILSRGGKGRSEIGDQSYEAGGDGEMLPGFRQETWC